MKPFLYFILGCVSWVCSYGVNAVYGEMTWRCLTSLLLVDLVFIFAFYVSGLNYIKRRWVLNLLLISIFATYISALTMAIAQAGFIYSDFFLLTIFESYYKPFCFVISLLVLFVLGTPQRIIGALDANYWPRSSGGVPYDLFMDSLHSRKGGEQ